jgi:hypothetical protein
MQRALEQMAQMTEEWAEQATRRGSLATADQWRRLHTAARPSPDDDVRLDPYLVGEMWWDLIRPRFADLHRLRRRRRYTRLRDLDLMLRARPLEIADTPGPPLHAASPCGTPLRAAPHPASYPRLPAGALHRTPRCEKAAQQG